MPWVMLADNLVVSDLEVDIFGTESCLCQYNNTTSLVYSFFGIWKYILTSSILTMLSPVDFYWFYLHFWKIFGIKFINMNAYELINGAYYIDYSWHEPILQNWWVFDQINIILKLNSSNLTAGSIWNLCLLNSNWSFHFKDLNWTCV